MEEGVYSLLNLIKPVVKAYSFYNPLKGLLSNILPVKTDLG